MRKNYRNLTSCEPVSIICCFCLFLLKKSWMCVYFWLCVDHFRWGKKKKQKQFEEQLSGNFLQKRFFFASPKHSTPVEKCRDQGSNNPGPLRWCKPGLQDCTRAVSLQFHPDSWSSGFQKVPGHFLHSYPQVGYGLILSLHEAVKTTNHVGILSSGLARTLRTTVAFRAGLISLVPAFFQNLARKSLSPY